MKFTWFNLMPWPYLPDDFRQTNHSVWVDIDSRLFDPAKSNAMYHEYMDQLEYAEELGFDGIGVNEHHQNGYGLMPSPNLIAAGLARRTSRAAICVIGNSIALYNPPIRVAEEFAMLDCISGGRLVAGFPVGTPMDTNFCYGQIPALTRDKYREAHELIMKAWASDEPFAFDGKYNQLRYVNCWPKPIQRPHPPVYIPGGGSIETWDFCLDHDYNYSYLSFGGYKRGKALLDGYWERVAERGKDESPNRAAFAQIICVADTDAEAERLYAEHILYFYNRCLHVFPGFADPPGYRTIKTIQAGALSQLSAEAQRAFSQVTWSDLVEGGHVIAGSPATVRDQMTEMITDLRIGHVFCLLHTGNQPDWKTRYSSELFAREVMPHLRGLWPDYEGDDRWWIHPLEGRVDPTHVAEVGAVTVVVDAAVIETGRGARCRVAMAGPPEGDPVVLLHGAVGPAGQEAFMSRLAEAGLRVFAPELPGYGESTGEDLLEDMLDFTLHGWDVVDALGIDQPVLIGHSMGGMIAAEMAAVSNVRPRAVVLIAPTGLWDDDHPIPDLFSLLPFQFAPLLFADQALGASLLTGGLDFDDLEALRDFLIANARRLGTAGKILFPIPNRRLSKRLYRLRAPTLVVWGSADQYHLPLYADRWQGMLPHADVKVLEGAAHMIPHEQPAELAAEVTAFLAAVPPLRR